MSSAENPDPPSPESIYARALAGDGALRWDIPLAISDRDVEFSAKIGSPFHLIVKYFKDSLKSHSQEHFRSLTSELLTETGISNLEIWTSVICQLTDELVSSIVQKQSKINTLLDARTQFQIELLPDEIGVPQDSCVIPGVVLRKNIAHRQMQNTIKRPKLMLIAGALELECQNLFQLHTDIKRENDFLVSAIDRILRLAPDLCIVERSVARCAVERLKEAKITLVYNVSMEDLKKLAIHTNAKIVQNVLEVNTSCLGSCSEFLVLPIKTSTNTNNARRPFPLMIFKDSSSSITCTAVLRGGSQCDLGLIKEILSFAVFAAYRLHLETAFLSDCLSITAASTAAFGVDGLAEEQWENTCSSIIQKCIQKTRNHQNSDRIEFVSPVIAKWTSHQSHQSIHQRAEYSLPVLDLQSSVPISKTQKLTSETNSISSNSLSLNPADRNPASESESGGVSLRHCCNCCDKELPSAGSGSDLLVGSASTPSSQSDNNNTQIDGEWSPWRTWADVESLRRSFQPNTGLHDHPLVPTRPLEPPGKLTIMQKQQFSGSFANRNHLKGKLCEESRVRLIEFCSEEDLSLLEFLKSIAADSKKLCPAGCGGGNASHLLTVLHGSIRLAVSVVPVPEQHIFPNPSSEIWLWTRPKGVQKEPMNCVSRIALSEESKNLSLAQFLQLAFNTPYLRVFGRQLFLEHVLYFGYGETAACVFEDRIQLKQINFPSPLVEYHTPLQVQWVQEAGRQVLEEAAFVYESLEKLCLSSSTSLSRRMDSYKALDGGSDLSKEEIKTPESCARESYMKFSLIPGIKEECEKFRSEVKSVMKEVLIATSEDTTLPQISNDQILESFLKLNALWRQLGINALSYSTTMDDPLDHTSWDLPLTKSTHFDRKFRKIGTRVSAPIASGNIPVPKLPGGTPPERCPSAGDLRRLGSKSAIEAPPDDHFLLDGIMTESPFMSMMLDEQQPSNQDSTNGIKKTRNLKLEIPSTASCSTEEGLKSTLLDSHQKSDQHHQLTEDAGVSLRRNSSIGIMQMLDREVEEFQKEAQNCEMMTPHLSMSLPGSPQETTLLNQLDRRLVMSIFDDEKPFRLQDNDLDSTVTTDLHSSVLPSPFQPPSEFLGHQSSPLEMAAGSLMPRGSKTGPQLSCRVMVPVGSDGLVIPVFESEPASIIAHVLSSISYHKDLQQSFENLSQRNRGLDSATELDGANVAQQGSLGPAEINMSRGSVLSVDASLLRGAKARTNNAYHIVQRVEDNPPGGLASCAKFEVVSYFAPQFSKLRNRCIDGGERSFIMSMSRSKKWKANGGKSKSYFAKTLDDRFIIKGASKSEKASFLETLGPCYFNYMEGQIKKREDVSLAKILGLFQVSMKSSSSSFNNNRSARIDPTSESVDLGKDWTLDLIVMENVFYNCECSSVYDLKGCHRTRFNSEAEKQKTSNQQSLVFLDSNLKKHNVNSPPLLVTQAYWDTLKETLCRDTDFLERNSVMDYSLLVGIDKSSNSLVISIIDYIRQFTWDKRLESWVKSSGLMGGEVNEDPTIISPKSYKERFISTLLGYFTIVPLYDDLQ